MGRYSSLTVVGALGGLDTVDTAQIDDDAVTYAKVQNVAADDVLLGRISGANGIVEEVTKAQTLTLLGVEANATADQTGAEIKTLYEAEANAFTDTKNTKLTGIDTGADVTADNAPQAHEASHKASGSDEILLDEFGAPTDVTTLNATTSVHGLLPKLGGGSTDYLRADGTWAEPSSNVITSGNYTGDGSVNKAIAHGLGVVPKSVFIAHDSGGESMKIIQPAFIGWISSVNTDRLSVTTANSTNFYVGNATSYSHSANENTRGYYWVAMA